MKSSAFKFYLNAVSNLYVSRKVRDPFRTKLIRVNCPKILLDSLSKYEKIPNHKEVVTGAMFEYIDKLAKSEPNDGIVTSLRD